MAAPNSNPPKYQKLLKGPIGRSLVVAEVATLVGAGVLYYKLSTDPQARSKLEQYQIGSWIVKGFDTVQNSLPKSSDK